MKGEKRKFTAETQVVNAISQVSSSELYKSEQGCFQGFSSHLVAPLYAQANMARFSLLWACLWCLGFVSTLVVSQNTTALKQALEKGGVQAVFPADSTYSDASGARE